MCCNLECEIEISAVCKKKKKKNLTQRGTMSSRRDSHKSKSSGSGASGTSGSGKHKSRKSKEKKSSKADGSGGSDSGSEGNDLMRIDADLIEAESQRELVDHQVATLKTQLVRKKKKKKKKN
jgi:hypothetical protein